MAADTVAGNGGASNRAVSAADTRLPASEAGSMLRTKPDNQLLAGR